MSSKSAFKPKAVSKKPRTPDEIKAEYNNICGQAGEAQFKMKTIEGDLYNFNQRLVELHKEFKEASAAAPVEPVAEEPAVETEHIEGTPV